MGFPSKIVECIPNFSEGVNRKKIDRIIAPLKSSEGLKLLDCQTDKDHNRMVVTLIGEPFALTKALMEACGIAISEIDMNHHKGAHPRMGAIDVVPFVPVKNVSMDEAVQISKSFAKTLSKAYGLPVFLYEKSANSPARANLSDIRKGEFEQMTAKLKQAEWKPDYGPPSPHETAGVTAVGARMPLVAFNVNLRTQDISVADSIAKKIRFIGGGLRYVKAIGIDLKEKGIVQVSMNLTDFSKTALYQAFEMIKVEAGRYGVAVCGSEVIGLLPMQALTDAAAFYLGLENFSTDQILESRLLE